MLSTARRWRGIETTIVSADCSRQRGPRLMARRVRNGTSSASSNARQAITAAVSLSRRFRWIPIPRKPTWRAHRTFRQAAVQVTWETRTIEPDRRTLRQGRETGANEAISASNPASNPLGSRAQSSLPRGKPAFTKVTWITFPVLNQSYVRSIKTSCTPACRR